MSTEPVMHTPGPWKVSKEGYIGAGELGIGPVVAKVAQFFGPGDRQRYEADRNLIAAAPEMLDALKRASRELTMYVDLQTQLDYIEYAARSQQDLDVVNLVIAKAEGRL